MSMRLGFINVFLSVQPKEKGEAILFFKLKSAYAKGNVDNL